MSKRLQLRGGTTTEHASFTGAVREVTVDTTKDTLVVHDGSTVGGTALSTAADVAAAIGAIDLTAAIATVIDTAPESLNTLNELAAALGDDANYSATVTTALGTKLPLAGGTMTGDIWYGDNVGAKFGTHGDFRIYHDGFHSYIRDYGTGDLIVTGSVIRLKSSAYEDMATFTENGAVTLFYDNATKLATASAGVDVTGNLAVSGTVNSAGGTMTGNTLHGDNVKDTYGTGADLEIYHDGSDSYIKDTGTGSLWVASNEFRVANAAATENMIIATESAAVKLYHNNALKLETTAAGVSVTGSMTASGNVTAYSDERLKSSVETIPDALSKVLNVRGVTFDMNAERGTGVIAQELEKVLPEAVFDNEDGMKSVAYGNVVGLLIEAIKEQQTQIETLMDMVGE